MSLYDPVFWLLLPLLFYGLIAGSWARAAARSNQTPGAFFTADKTLAPWMTALAHSAA